MYATNYEKKEPMLTHYHAITRTFYPYQQSLTHKYTHTNLFYRRLITLAHIAITTYLQHLQNIQIKYVKKMFKYLKIWTYMYIRVKPVYTDQALFSLHII